MLRSALAALETERLKVVRVSSIYETEPQNLKAQGWFLNLVAEIETSLFPKQLLARVQRVEQELGRRRVIAKGPRTIDIDIVLYGKAVVNALELVIPHAAFRERRFVLEPLAELAPELRDPVTRKTVRELLGALKGQTVKRVAS